jgi:hypothetical protein
VDDTTLLVWIVTLAGMLLVLAASGSDESWHRCDEDSLSLPSSLLVFLKIA